MDLATIFLMQTGLYAISMVALISNWAGNREIPETRYWAIAAVWLFGGVIAAALAEAGYFESVHIVNYLADSVTAIAFVFLLSGVRYLTGRQPISNRVLITFAVLLILLQIIADGRAMADVWRPAIVAFSIALINGVIAWHLLFPIARMRRRSTVYVLLISLVFLAGIAMGMRGYIVVANGFGAMYSEMMEREGPFFVMALSVSGFAICFVLLTVEKLQTRLQDLADRDPLTGLLNRHAFVNAIKPLVGVSRREGQYACLALFDLDHFKHINDKYGHAAGDVLLQHFARTISSSLRSSDVVARFGGEEFVALLCGPFIENLNIVAERVRITFERATVDFNGEKIGTTVSVGLCIVPASLFDYERHSHEADEALYESKASGRNKVVVRHAN